MSSLSTDTQYMAVGVSSVTFTNPLREGVLYQIVSSTACWVNFSGTSPTAVAAVTGNTYIPPNFPIQIIGPEGGANKVAIIQDSAGGKATLTSMI